MTVSRDDAPLAAGDQTLLRRLNATAVLAVLREHGPHTVRELATHTRLSRPTVDGAIAELVASGWVAELPPEAGGMGRPARRYRFRADAGFVLGIDVGAHKVLAMLSDLDGRIAATHRLVVDPADGARERLAAAATVARRCAASVGAENVRGVGVATPGVVDASGRVTITDVLPEWSGLSLADELGGLVASPVLVENDATLAALAERWRGAAADADDVLYILAGQRVGAGILLAGKPHRGHHGAAGELHADFLGFKRVGLDQPLLAAAARGEPQAVAAVDEFTRRLATYVAALVLALDPELVVIGGGLSRASELFLPRLESTLGGLCLVPPRLAASTMGDESVAIGALRLALDDAHRRLLTI